MNNRDSKGVNVPGMLFPTDVAQTCYGLFPAIYVVYFIYKVYMFSKLAVVILLLFCSFSIADNLCNYQLLFISISWFSFVTYVQFHTCNVNEIGLII
jgi:hypothetical protein